MESQESNHSLLSRGQSELRSRFMVESGVFMSSFAATIFVAALVAIGVLMLTLLVALSIMLNSCQSGRDTGEIELSKTEASHDGHYDYCHLFTLHYELNSLKSEQLPEYCRQHGHRFLYDLNLTIRLVEQHFSTLKAKENGIDVILVDGDDLLSPKFRGENDGEGGNGGGLLVLIRLYMKLQSSGWSLICFTRKAVGEWNATVHSLHDAGYGGWSSLIMRCCEDEGLMGSWEYMSTQRRVQLVEGGFRIAGVISSRMDAFRGSNLGERNFKLPNPSYYYLPDPSTDLDT